MMCTGTLHTRSRFAVLAVVLGIALVASSASAFCTHCTKQARALQTVMKSHGCCQAAAAAPRTLRVICGCAGHAGGVQLALVSSGETRTRHFEHGHGINAVMATRSPGGPLTFAPRRAADAPPLHHSNLLFSVILTC